MTTILIHYSPKQEFMGAWVEDTPPRPILYRSAVQQELADERISVYSLAFSPDSETWRDFCKLLASRMPIETWWEWLEMPDDEPDAEAWLTGALNL